MELFSYILFQFAVSTRIFEWVCWNIERKKMEPLRNVETQDGPSKKVTKHLDPSPCQPVEISSKPRGTF
jgi:hypothetical protein